MKRILLFLSALLGLINSAQSSHIMGGELTYDWLGGNDYRVRYTFYRDCAGIPAPNSVVITYGSVGCGATGLSATLYPTPASPVLVAPVCPSAITTCQGGLSTGIEQWSYEGTVLLFPCPDWVIEYTECCRNASITNLVNASSENGYFSAFLNNVATPFNNLARFANAPVPFLYTGLTNQINNGAYDLDNDSIVVTLAPALSGPGTSILYNPGFSATTPIMSSPAMTVDPANGNMVVTPTQQDVDVVGYQVQEYRNGVLIGAFNRDIQVTIVNSASNLLPALSGINGTPSFNTTACAGDTVRFWIYSSDPNASDSTTISFSGNAASLITSSSSGGAQDSVEIELITDGSLVSPQPYLLYATVRDNACPYNGLQTYAYTIYVNGCGTDVWPGDANNDLNCNLYDILPIGVGFGSSGPVRSGASLSWVAQPATDWSQNFVSGMNYKYADTDGDGTITWSDTTAIGLNYGLNHPARLAPPTTSTAIGNLFLVASEDTVGPSGQMQVAVQLGQGSQPVPGIYGVAFRLSFNPMVVDAAQSNFAFLPTSGMGTVGTNLLTFVRPNWSAGYVDAVAVRMDHTNASSDTTIALFDVVIIDNVSARTVCNFELTGVRAITQAGIYQQLTTYADSVDVNSIPTGVSSPAALASIRLYPNPANTRLNWTGKETVSSITIADHLGRTVSYQEIGDNSRSISLETIPAGYYFVTLQTQSGATTRPLCIQR